MQQEIGMPEEGEQFADEDDRNGTKTNGNSHSRYKCSATSKDRWTDSEKQGLYLKWVCKPDVNLMYNKRLTFFGS